MKRASITPMAPKTPLMGPSDELLSTPGSAEYYVYVYGVTEEEAREHVDEMKRHARDVARRDERRFIDRWLRS